MKRITIFIIGICIFSNCFSQSNKKYQCPIKDPKAIVHRSKDAASPSKVLTIDCDECNIYNCAKGKVTKIRQRDGVLIVDLLSGDRIFSYYNLDTVVVKEGQKVKKGQRIGKLKKDNSFTLIITTTSGDIVNASKLITCKK